MIALFVAPFTPPALMDLKVRDSQSGMNVPVGGLEGFDSDYLQAQTITYAPLTFIDLGEFTTDGDSISAWCLRLSKGIIQLSFSVALATVNMRILGYDTLLNEMVSDVIPMTAGTRTDGNGDYMAPAYEFDLNGASRIAVAFDTISSGSVYGKLAGV